MKTFLVTPPSSKEQFEVEAEAHFYDNNENTITFRDQDNAVIASYIALPGTIISEKETGLIESRMT